MLILDGSRLSKKKNLKSNEEKKVAKKRKALTQTKELKEKKKKLWTRPKK